MEAQFSSEVGTVGRLFSANVDLFWGLLQRLATTQVKGTEIASLRNEFARYYFWGDGYYPFEGKLDEILSKSTSLRDSVLRVLSEVGEILVSETGLYGIVSRFTPARDGELAEQREELQRLVDAVGQSFDTSEDNDSDTDSFAEISSLGEIIQSLQSRNRCLAYLSIALDRPVPDATVLEEDAPVNQAITVTGPAESWVRKIQDQFPKIDVGLAARLGEANWERFERISSLLEKAAETADVSSEESEQEEPEYEVSAFTESTAQESIFTGSKVASGYGATTATSVSQRAFERYFPRARIRKLAKDVRSQATFTSVVTDDQGERGWLRVPPLPIKAEDLGEAFRCTICGDKQHEIYSRTDWKRHVFQDLEPYVCTFGSCERGLKSFSTRREWGDHELTVHRLGQAWTCQQCEQTFTEPTLLRWHLEKSHAQTGLNGDEMQAKLKAAESTVTSLQDIECPVCRERPGTNNRAFVMHLAKHMEEVALAVLPRNADQEDDQGSHGSDQSLDSAKRQGAEPPTESTGPPKDSQPPPQKAGPKWSINDFNLLKVIGRGNFAKIFLVQSKTTKQLYAAKVLKKDFLIENDEVKGTWDERTILKLATEQRFPFITRFFGCFQSETRLWFLTEYVIGGDLMSAIQKDAFSLARVKFYAAEVVLCIQWMHSQGIIYRDLKLDNILLDTEGHIRLVDFGVSKTEVFNDTKTSTFCGTPEFMAPEILYEKAYGHEVDWWAFGVLVYQMLYRQSPFKGEDEDQIYDSILEGKPTYSANTPQHIVSFLSRLLEPDAEKRLGHGPNGAEDVMREEFFINMNWDDLYNKRVTPPFRPLVADPTAVSNFDSEFTSMEPVLTPIESVLTHAMQEEFQGFSFSFE